MADLSMDDIFIVPELPQINHIDSVSTPHEKEGKQHESKRCNDNIYDKQPAQTIRNENFESPSSPLVKRLGESVEIEGGMNPRSVVKLKSVGQDNKASMIGLQTRESEKSDDFINETNSIESGKSFKKDVKLQKRIDEGSIVTNLNSHSASPGQRPEHLFRYYAVRVGYATASYFREDEDGLEVKQEIRLVNRTAPMVKIRSAIFLYWDDVCQFLEEIRTLDQDSSLVFKAEYEGFHTIAGAEAYLLEPEMRLALDHASSVEPLLETEKIAISQPWQIAPHYSCPGAPLRPTVRQPKMAHPLTLTPVTRQLTAESAASDELEDKKIMNRRPPKVTQSRKSRKKKLQAIRNCEPHGKDLIRDEPEPIRQSQGEDTKVKKSEERKEVIMKKKWTTMFQKLLDYKEKHHGFLDIPFSEDDIGNSETTKGTASAKHSTEEREIRKLRRWCEEQKRLHLKWARDKSSSDFFTQEKYDKLKEAGFDFPEPKWDEQYTKLKAYKDTHGTLKVERKHDLCLYRWSVKQRNILGKHFEGKPVNISQERLKKLAELGWQKALDKRSKVRDTANEQKKWDEKFQELLMYKERNGHMSFSPCNIKNDEFISIRYWVRKIRKEYQKLQSGKESTLTAMQMKRLSDIGFDFNPHGINGNKSHKERWESRLQALKEYKARKGDFTLNEREDPKMYHIILNIRKAYKAREKGAKNGLTDERIAQLEEIGFDFTRRKAPTVRDVPRSWEERFQQLL